MHLPRSVTWTRLTVGVLGVGLLAGAGWYAGEHDLGASLTRGVLAQEAPTATPAPATMPAPATTPGAAKKPAQQNQNSRRPTGEVVSISPDPATFTIKTADGAQQTFRVLQTTIFAAGRDRPYRFELLKVGDTVTVRGGTDQGQGQGAKQGVKATQPGADGQQSTSDPARAAASPAPKPGNRAATKPGNGPRAAARAAEASGEIVARQVLVRPAGETSQRLGGKKQNGPGGKKQPAQQQPAVQPTSQPAGQTTGEHHGTGA